MSYFLRLPLSPVFLFPLPHLPFVFRFSLSPLIFFCCYPVLFLPLLVFSLILTCFFFSFSFPFTLFVSVYPNIFFPISFSSYFPLLPYLLFLSLPLLLFPSVLSFKLIFLFVSWQNLTFNHWISHILHFWHNCIYLSFYIRMEKKTQGKPSLQWKPRTSTSLQTFCSDVDGHRGQCVFVYSYLKAFFHCFIISQPFWYHFEESSIFIYG